MAPDLIHGLERLVSVIISADIVGYSSMMHHDEDHAMQQLKHFEKALDSHVDRCYGEVIKSYGDGCLILFPSAVNAVDCSMLIQEELRQKPTVPLRIGIHVGEIVKKNRDIFGNGVNIAARIESMGTANSILVSEDIYHQIKNHKEFECEDLGPFSLKNIDRVINIYAISNEGLSVPELKHMKGKGFAIPKVGAPRWPRILITLIVLASFGIGLRYLYPGTESVPTLTNNAVQHSSSVIAVLPFLNNKSDPNTDYFGFAIADQIISDLSYLSSINVRPSSVVRKYDQQVVDVQEVGKSLHVDYVLMGNYLQERDSIRLSIELIHVKSSKVLWRNTIRTDYKNAFELQDIVAEHVIRGMDQNFSASERQRMRKDVPADPLAYEYYLRSISYPFTTEGNELAIQMLQQSLLLDSNYAPAHNHLGVRWNRVGQYGMITEDIELAEQSYRKALSLNPELLSALANLATLCTETNRMAQGMRYTKKSLELNPNNANIQFALGYIYRYAGMNSLAIEQMVLVNELDPKNILFRSIGITYMWANQDLRAIEEFEKFEETTFIAYNIGFALQRLGHDREAKPYFEKALASDAASLTGLMARMNIAILNGELDRAINLGAQFENKKIRDPETWYYYAGMYGAAGDVKGCLRALSYCVNSGFFNYPLFLKDPLLQSVRNEPGFAKILEKAKKEHFRFKAELDKTY